MRGFKKRNGEHYNSHKISSPVTNDATIHLLFISMMVTLNSLDILLMSKKAFRHRQFRNEEEIYIDTLEGLENFMIPANGYCCY